MDTNIKTKKQSSVEGEKPLDHKQATWVAAWLKDTDRATTKNYLLVYEMLPSMVAELFGVELSDVQAAMKGEKRNVTK